MPSSSQQSNVVDAPLSILMEAGGSWQDLRSAVRSERGDDLWQDVLLQSRRVLMYSRHHWLKYTDGEFDRQGFKSATEAIAEAGPAEMSPRDAQLMFCLYVLGCANLGLEQVAKVLSTESVEQLVESRWSSYISVIGCPDDLGEREPTLAERARRLREMRIALERTHYRYSVIDGEQWFRDEKLMPRNAVGLDEVPECFCRPSDDGQSRASLRAASLERIERGESLEEFVVEIMRHALADEQLGIDHITLTAPRKLGSIPQEDLHQRANIYRRTETRTGLDLDSYEAQLGHASDERLKRVIGARMQVLKLKAAKQYFGDGCLAGEALEKSGDYMIFFNEDAHYPGHRNAGCSTGGRAPIPLMLERGGERLSFPGIFADLRAVRLSHDPKLRFTEKGLMKVMQYASWISTVLGAVYDSDIEFGATDPAPAPNGAACPAEQRGRAGESR
jgi:hypothetical protein